MFLRQPLKIGDIVGFLGGFLHQNRRKPHSGTLEGSSVPHSLDFFFSRRLNNKTSSVGERKDLRNEAIPL